MEKPVLHYARTTPEAVRQSAEYRAQLRDRIVMWIGAIVMIIGFVFCIVLPVLGSLLF